MRDFPVGLVSIICNGDGNASVGCIFIRPKRSIAFGRIMEILYWAKTVFTRSAITLPKVNRFG